MSRHPSTTHLLQYFTHAHLPAGPLRDVSSQLGSLARDMVAQLPETKDCFVRAALDIPKDES